MELSIQLKHITYLYNMRGALKQTYYTFI